MLHVTTLIFKKMQSRLFIGIWVAVAFWATFFTKKGCNSLFFGAFLKFSEQFLAVTTVTLVLLIVASSYCCNGNIVVTAILKTSLLLHSCYNLLHLCYKSCYKSCYILFY